MAGTHEPVVAKGVVDEADEGGGVADDLDGGDVGAPEEDGADDEEDVFEDAGEGCDEAGGFADLFFC